MATEPVKLFWDSCVFCAYLYDQKTIYDVAAIEQFLKEIKLKPPPWIIFTSSFVLLEVLNSKIVRPHIGSMTEFINDFVSQIIVIDASPNIMQLAGRLRDIPYKKGNSAKRVLGPGDSVMLATALYLSDAFGVRIDEFHTFDRGEKGKTVPILTYEEWCEDLTGEDATFAKRVRDLKRCPPKHPTPELPLSPSSEKGKSF